MTSHGSLLITTMALAVCLETAFASAKDITAWGTDGEIDQWLRISSPTYAALAAEIEARSDIQGYRFVSAEDVRGGMVLWVNGCLEIRLNKDLSGAERATTIIFEVANGSRHRDHQQIDLATDQQVIGSAAEFGLAHEMIEYEALRIHRQVLLELDERAGPLPPGFFRFVTPPPASARDYRLPSLSAYLKAQKESGHTQHYYELYLQRAARCQRAASEPRTHTP